MQNLLNAGESLFYLENIVNYSKDIISIKNLNCEYLYCNKAFYEFFGIPEDIPKKNINILDFLDQDNFNIFYLYFQKVLQDKSNQVFKISLKLNGETKTLQVLIYPIFKNEELKEIVCVSRDITDVEIQRLRLLAENHDLQTLLESKNSLELKKEDYLMTLIHDLKNPLQGQIKSLDLLLKGYFGKLNDNQIEVLKMTMESMAFAQELLYSVLTSYKYDHGEIILEKSYINVVSLFKNCMNEINLLAKDRGINIKFSSALNNGEEEVLLDACKIRRVITNILNNSLKYAFKNTDLHIKISKNFDMYIFEIENISPAIPEYIKEHLFEKYITGANSYRKNGSGLGLYLSKQIIEAHGGRIYLTANDTHNKFTFELPLD